jgi:MYXO-CTERM domain-containing protein
MRKFFAWLGVATLAVVASPEAANAGEPLKPYVLLILDTSGSMVASGSNNPTGFGPPSCGGLDNKLGHATCAINRIVNSYGDMVFGLARFRATVGDTISGGFPNGCCMAGAQLTGFGSCASGPTCTNGQPNDHMFQLLTSLVDGDNELAAAWTNGTANTCTTSGSDPEIWDRNNAGCNGANGTCGGATPNDGALRGAKRYFQGLQATDNTVLWPSNLPGFDPIRTDPTKTSFLPSGSSCNPSPSCTTNCCTEQCRPYITILLTDGDESCFGDPTVGAASLLTTDVDNRRYRIETRPIGFGVPVPTASIESIAQAGGGNAGLYAQNEAELQAAISSILDDAIKTERCNGLDDDCDGSADEDFEPAKGEACSNGAVGQCLRTGTLVCNNSETGLTCNAPSVACVNNVLVPGGGPCGEICNNLDDDCDGKIDENLTTCSCSPQQEQCNGRDDDCDGRVDEASTNGPPLTRPCGTGTCSGIETCNFVANCGALPGAPNCSGFGGCTAPAPTAETCNGLDDNCDGIKDGLQAQCSTMNPLPPENFAVDDPRNNPGDPSNNPIPENICHPGFKVCPVVAGPPNNFGSCQNEVKPCNSASNNAPDSCTDGCNGLDDDCDNLIDEDFQPADCSNGCGIGTTQCIDGVLSCNSVAQPPGSDGCNNVDDDCDGNTDEDFACDDQTPKPGFPATCNPKPASCDPSPTCTSDNCCCACTCSGGPNTCAGEQVCASGTKLCQAEPAQQESCDCSDNNCNGQTDEGNLCAAGSTCNEFCQCAFPCAQTEFPCPLGKFCKQETTACSTNTATCDPSDACTQNPNNTNCCCRSLCITDPCFGITCPPQNGSKQVCQVNAAGNAGTCVDACSVAECPANFVCIPDTGECKPDDCTTFPDRCSENQNCIAGVCVTNLCKDVTCPTDQYCAGGNCVNSCADIECPSGQRCRLGVCEDDPCGTPCPFGQACNDNSGQCVPDGCGTITCPQGQYCNPNNNGGTCETDLCVGTSCPSPDQVCKGGTCFDPEDLGPDGGVETRVTAGGGGGCSTGGDAGLVLLGLALLFVRRRRDGGGKERA